MRFSEGGWNESRGVNVRTEEVTHISMAYEHRNYKKNIQNSYGSFNDELMDHDIQIQNIATITDLKIETRWIGTSRPFHQYGSL